MPKRQAAAEEVTEGVAATYVHGDDAAAEVAEELRDGIQEMLAVNLMPSTVWSLKYTAHGFPTIDNVELLRAEAQFWSLGEEKLRHCSLTRRRAQQSRQVMGTSRRSRLSARSQGSARQPSSQLYSMRASCQHSCSSPRALATGAHGRLS